MPVNRLLREANDYFDDETDTKTFSAIIYNGFFAPYESATDVLSELVAPLTIPVAGIMFVAAYLIEACIFLANAIMNLISLGLELVTDVIDQEDEKTAMQYGLDSLSSLTAALIFVVLTAVLPIVSIVTIFTRTGATIGKCAQNTEESQHYDHGPGYPV